MSRAVPILQVDAFTDRPFAGNPAGVVLDAAGLSEVQMERIAAEMNLAETAFVSPTDRQGARCRLRWFTPTREVTYCGHATVATVHAMLEAGGLVDSRIVFDTLGGLLPVAVERGAGGALIWLEPALPACAPYQEPLPDLLETLGLPPSEVGVWARPAVTPDADVLLPVRDLAALRSLEPDMNRLGRFGGQQRLRGFCVVSPETVESASAIHSRFFAPHYGIPEDIVTGSVHSSLGVWLLEAGRLAVEGDVAAFTTEQGDTLGRPGRLSVQVRLRDGRASGVRVGGRAVTVLSGSIRLP